MFMPVITREHENVQQLIAQIGDELVRYNEAVVGPDQNTRFAFAVRDDDGGLLGGLTAEKFWNALYVHQLWVDEKHRTHGFGSGLLKAAEDVAREHDCDVVYLSTFAFQAPAFYEKQGYAMIGELPDVPRGYSRRWFAKRLRDVG
jgi:GNAT superfamily N-acetyltransferase